jgi:hypothetical protein
MRKLIILIAALALFSCESERAKRREERNKPELIYETDHCRYYCLADDGFGNCKVMTCDCDEGYSCDTSTSW